MFAVYESRLATLDFPTEDFSDGRPKPEGDEE
jgi:hypothetical protein